MYTTEVIVLFYLSRIGVYVSIAPYIGGEKYNIITVVDFEAGTTLLFPYFKI